MLPWGENEDEWGVTVTVHGLVGSLLLLLLKVIQIFYCKSAKVIAVFDVICLV